MDLAALPPAADPSEVLSSFAPPGDPGQGLLTNAQILKAGLSPQLPGLIPESLGVSSGGSIMGYTTMPQLALVYSSTTEYSVVGVTVTL